MAEAHTFAIDPEFRWGFNFPEDTRVIRLEDWLGLLTLCFAPLLGHIISGVPTIVRRSRKTPSWLDQMCLYNPTTILWRYLAIVDRRVRQKSWSAADMAASNAYFWTDDGWDGSEEMMIRSRAFCARTPSHNRTELLSTDTLKTVIATLQGIQAITVMVRGILGVNGIGNRTFVGVIALDNIFYPLASLGILRLFAAMWLTEEYSFIECRTDTGAGTGLMAGESSYHLPSYAPSTGDEEYSLTSKPTPAAISSTTFLAEDLQEHPSNETSRPASHWRAVTVRTAYLVCLAVLLVICAFLTSPPPKTDGVDNLSSTGTPNVLWLLAAIYIVLTITSIVTLSFYLVRHRNSMTTVLPCLSSWWYRLYTFVLLGASIAMIVLAGIYTRRTSCGRFTVVPSILDPAICPGAPVRANSESGPFGFTTRQTLNSIDPDTGAVKQVAKELLVRLDGWCSGTLVGNLTEISPVR
ncbi:hypothetical protein PHISCL_00943 [Aspergillus sclerotialis]|uniref:Uncharacterized protein n=1 Tax=Aspergillus sclerotialis TaxID=2070753 RepID=A0A3A2ZU95_9EURO|nr:hypothetical protein PHISCL_00943 [Aspergillus sclerotialis]